MQWDPCRRTTYGTPSLLNLLPPSLNLLKITRAWAHYSVRGGGLWMRRGIQGFFDEGLGFWQLSPIIVSCHSSRKLMQDGQFRRMLAAKKALPGEPIFCGQFFWEAGGGGFFLLSGGAGGKERMAGGRKKEGRKEGTQEGREGGRKGGRKEGRKKY